LSHDSLDPVGGNIRGVMAGDIGQTRKTHTYERWKWVPEQLWRWRDTIQENRADPRPV
jgi:hypothetical protein